MSNDKFFAHLLSDFSQGMQRKPLKLKKTLLKGFGTLLLLGMAFAFLFAIVPPDVSFETLSWNAENFLNIQFQLLFLVLALCFATFGAFSSGVPGFFESLSRPKRVLLRVVPFVCLLGWCLSLIVIPEQDWSGVSDYFSELSWNWESKCSLSVLQWGFGAMTVFGFALWRLSFTNAFRSSVFVSVASFAFGALVVLFQCPYDVGVHHIVWHGAPLLVVAFANTFVMAKFYKL